ncbi:unnamed protein product [Ambrosiozyma monospora]|uniref:Unnamed protein product n=1 Tax=Ambrosiozyma monospora TaxID=43982 RepID=A0ACB5UBW9_AMBMO|nr:unnamed protein product [Ambrosiozyma monospora]
MACGALFFKSDEVTWKTAGGGGGNGGMNGGAGGFGVGGGLGNEDFEDEGYRYFIAARKLIDITDTRDTLSFQPN